MASIMIFIGAFLTSDSHQVGLAIVFIFAIFFISFQNISIDAAAIKELRNPNLVATLHEVLITTG